MEERHTAEIIELKQMQLSSIKNENADPSLGEDKEDHQMLLNLVRVKDEEIRQLKKQLEGFENMSLENA